LHAVEQAEATVVPQAHHPVPLDGAVRGIMVILLPDELVEPNAGRVEGADDLVRVGVDLAVAHALERGELDLLAGAVTTAVPDSRLLHPVDRRVALADELREAGNLSGVAVNRLQGDVGPGHDVEAVPNRSDRG